VSWRSLCSALSGGRFFSAPQYLPMLRFHPSPCNSRRDGRPALPVSWTILPWKTRASTGKWSTSTCLPRCQRRFGNDLPGGWGPYPAFCHAPSAPATALGKSDDPQERNTKIAKSAKNGGGKTGRPKNAGGDSASLNFLLHCSGLLQNLRDLRAVGVVHLLTLSKAVGRLRTTIVGLICETPSGYGVYRGLRDPGWAGGFTATRPWAMGCNACGAGKRVGLRRRQTGRLDGYLLDLSTLPGVQPRTVPLQTRLGLARPRLARLTSGHQCLILPD
jgi:hypothetical protein